MIFTVGGIKGGSGKSTIATNLAIWLSKKGFDILLVDTDEQQTATKFSKWRELTTNSNSGYTTAILTGETVRPQILKLKEKFDHIIIDTGGRDTMSQRAALSVSDVYLVPFNPRSFDLWTIADVENLVKDIRSIKDSPIKAYTFLNKADAKGSDNQDAAEMLADNTTLKFINHYLVNRKSFGNTSANGLSIIEGNPIDEKAEKEINELFVAVLTDLDVKYNA